MVQQGRVRHSWHAVNGMGCVACAWLCCPWRVQQGATAAVSGTSAAAKLMELLQGMMSDGACDWEGSEKKGGPWQRHLDNTS